MSIDIGVRVSARTHRCDGSLTIPYRTGYGAILHAARYAAYSLHSAIRTDTHANTGGCLIQCELKCYRAHMHLHFQKQHVKPTRAGCDSESAWLSVVSGVERRERNVNEVNLCTAFTVHACLRRLIVDPAPWSVYFSTAYSCVAAISTA